MVNINIHIHIKVDVDVVHRSSCGRIDRYNPQGQTRRSSRSFSKSRDRSSCLLRILIQPNPAGHGTIFSDSDSDIETVILDLAHTIKTSCRQSKSQEFRGRSIRDSLYSDFSESPRDRSSELRESVSRERFIVFRRTSGNNARTNGRTNERSILRFLDCSIIFRENVRIQNTGGLFSVHSIERSY